MTTEPWLEPVIEDIRGTLFLDIGANEGTWTQWASKRFACVHAYEPDIRAFEKLESSAKCNVVCHCMAVADFVGDAELSVHESSEQSSLLDVHPFGDGHSVAVKKIPTFVTSVKAEGLRADWAKIDVEGGEVAVCRGLPDAYANLMIECHGTLEEVKEVLREKGYFGKKLAIVVEHPLGIKGHEWLFVEGLNGWNTDLGRAA